MGRIVLRAFDLLKAAAASQGETRVWSDGMTHKKIGKKWVTVKTASGIARSETAKVMDTWRDAQQHFDYAMSTNLGESVESILREEGVDSYESLVEKIKTGSQSTSHELYKKLVDQIGAGPGTPQDKGAALNLIGTALVKLYDQFMEKPKVALTVKTTTKTGRIRYEPKAGRALPVLKPTSVKTAKKKIGGWSVTGTLETKHVRAMIKNKSAKLIFGEINPKRKWHLPKKAEDMGIKYRGKELVIRVKQIKKAGQRTRATAKVEIRIPYAFAKAYLQTQVKSTKTAKNLIFRMEHSEGYRKFLERSAA